MATFFFAAAAGALLAFALLLAAPPAAANDNQRWLEQTYRAFVLAVRGEHAPAAKQLAAIGEARGDPHYLREAAKEAMRAGDANAAAIYAGRRVVLGGGDEAKLHYAEILLYASQWRQAENELAALINESLIDDAKLFDWLRRFGGAEASGIGARLFSANGRDYLARLAITGGDWQLAQKSAAEGLANNDGRAVWHFLAARAAEGESGIRAALAKLDDYLAANCPGIADRRACSESAVLFAYQRLATAQEWDAPLHHPAAFSRQAAYSAGALLESAGELARAGAQFGRYDDLYSRLGMARLRLAKNNKAEAMAIVDATKVKNHHEFSLRERSAALIAGLIGGEQKRLQRLIAARQIAPDDYFLLYEHALAAEENGDIGAAISLLRRLVELFPDDAQAQNALGYVLADHNMHLEEAQRHIQAALDISRVRRANAAVNSSAGGFAAYRPVFVDDANILDSLGWVHYRRGNLQEAKLWLGKAASLSGAAEIAAHYGEVLWQTGDRAKAAEVWRAGLKTDPDNKTLKKTLTRFVPAWK